MPQKKDPAKLTLRLEREVIEAAKKFAEAHGTSLSELVENHFRNIAIREPARRYGGGGAEAEADAPAEDEWKKELGPITRSLLGIAANPDIDVDEEDYWRYLEQKHSRE